MDDKPENVHFEDVNILNERCNQTLRDAIRHFRMYARASGGAVASPGRPKIVRF
jgi:hypothetical protein